MKITITVEDPTPEVLEKLLALAAVPAAVVTAVPDDRWTPERARSYYDRLPPRAQQILLQVIEGDGECGAEELKANGRSLRGSTGAFRRVLSEGKRTGIWPEGLPVPVVSHVVGGQLKKIEMPGRGTEQYVLPEFEEGLGDLRSGGGSGGGSGSD
ncbi:hypothetical protein [Streptomyces sp. 1331.2]|uniref:hypothetical protein n=1 Tax=Streptomyces sp. 1331.2 TaxID=1938835 RepID=UPI000BDA7BAC|nr:hypothetical protein [Streptomyces sp. 1331.2]SOB88438.1 hypothetical protein SAMN06272789_6719 [Streptomyces sp. 1331.2]